MKKLLVIEDDFALAMGIQFALKAEDFDVVVANTLKAADEANIVQGLDIGADDYITKPFGVKELSSRIKATLRRYEKNSKNNDIDGELRNIGEFVINRKKNTVSKNGEQIILTPSEYKLLMELIENKNIILERNILIQRLWDIDESFVDDNTLSVYIKRLRDKIESNPSNPKYIITARGRGYSFKDE